MHEIHIRKGKLYFGGVLAMNDGTKNEMMQRIEKAALQLFTHQGFDGTSIREIATAAKCNVANISYYFDSKKGLLEYLMKQYFETYFSYIHVVLQDENNQTMTDLFLQLVDTILHYQFENRQLTRFVQREILLDTTLAREIMTTYFMREKYIFSSIIHEGKRTKEFQKVKDEEVLLYVGSYLSAPFIYEHYMNEVLHCSVWEKNYASKYILNFHQWFHRNLLNQVAVCKENFSV